MKKLLNLEPTPILFAVAGFISAVILFSLYGSYLLFGRSMQTANSLIGLTATAFALPTSPSPTPLETIQIIEVSPVAPTGNAEIFNVLESKLYTEPQYVLDTLAALLEEPIPVLDAARAHLIVSDTYEVLGDFDLAETHRAAIIEILAPEIEGLSGPLEIGEAYYFLIDSAFWLGDYDLAGEYDEQLSDDLDLVLSELKTAREIGEVYSALIKFESLLGDEEQAQAYNQELIEKMVPLIDGLTTPNEITAAYEFLIYSNIDLDQTDIALIYLDELVARLTPLIDQTEDPEELALIYLYLGNAEFSRGRYQFAAAYFDRLVRYDRTPFAVYSLAYYYSLSGDNGCAHHWFNIFLMEFGDEEGQEEYVGIAEQTIAFVGELYSGNVPDCP